MLLPLLSDKEILPVCLVSKDSVLCKIAHVIAETVLVLFLDWVSECLDVTSDIGHSSFDFHDCIVLLDHLLESCFLTINACNTEDNISLALSAFRVLWGAESWLVSWSDLAETLFPVMGVEIFGVFTVCLACKSSCSVTGKSVEIEVSDLSPAFWSGLWISIRASALSGVMNISVTLESSSLSLKFNLLWCVEVFDEVITASFGAFFGHQGVVAFIMSSFLGSIFVVMFTSFLPVLSKGYDKVFMSVQIAFSLDIGESISAMSVSLLVETPVIVVVLCILYWVLSVFLESYFTISQVCCGCVGCVGGCIDWCCFFFWICTDVKQCNWA